MTEQSEARDQMTALIAKALHDADCGCGDYDPAAEDESMPYSAQADVVMALFPEVELIQEGRYADGSWPQRAHEFPNYIDPTHTRYELSTAPEPIKQ